MIMRDKSIAVLLLSALFFVGCGNESENKDITEVSPSLMGVVVQGESQDEVIRNLVEEIDEFDYYDDERKGISRINYCGIPFGINLRTEQAKGITTITDITLITSHQGKAEFEAIKSGISKRFGNPDIEDYESGMDEIDGRFYGRCEWYKDDIDVTLRNVHDEEGGFVVMFSHQI